MKNRFAPILKQVLRAAAKLGIDEAGTRIMGSAWKPFKTMCAPVVSELERRFPSLFLLEVPKGEKPSEEAQLAAERAIAELNSNEQLQKMLVQNFNDLEEGQDEIAEKIGRIEVRLEAIDVSLAELGNMTDERFGEVISQLATISDSVDRLSRSVKIGDQAILVPLALDLPEESIEAYVSAHIPGVGTIELATNTHRRHQTIDVLFPRPGTYRYRLEHKEVTKLYKRVGNDFIPELVPLASVHSDEVEIEPDTVYVFERESELGAGGVKISMCLTKLLTSKEREEQDANLPTDLDEIDRLLG